MFAAVSVSKLSSIDFEDSREVVGKVERNGDVVATIKVRTAVESS
jgi:hypothetical protein